MKNVAINIVSEEKLENIFNRNRIKQNVTGTKKPSVGKKTAHSATLKECVKDTIAMNVNEVKNMKITTLNKIAYFGPEIPVKEGKNAHSNTQKGKKMVKNSRIRAQNGTN